MNKTKITIILLFLFLILILSILVFSKQQKTESVPQPIPTYSPPPTSTGQVINQQQELQAEQNYAKERQKILNERPWILKMPLRNEDYFLTYDTELDVFDVTIYISNRFPKDEQIDRIKQRINKDLATIGVDVNKAKINYTEKEI